MTENKFYKGDDNKMEKSFYYSEIKRKQPTENIGTIGHVSHGKSTIVKAIADKFTPRHSLEKERNITIDLGYANTRIYYSEKYDKFLSTEKICEDSDYELKNHISFVDCPGHNNFIATMCAGTKAFNAALVVISASDPIPQPQTLKHIEILKYTDIKDVLIVFNKIDLLKSEFEINKKVEELKDFISQHSHLQNKPIIAVSAYKKVNIDKILAYLSNIQNKTIFESVNQDELLDVLRTFDVNPIGQNINKMIGGVIGVSIKSGYIELGNKVGIFPGYMKKNIENKWEILPIFTEIKSLKSENEFLDIAFPGGLKALGLDCDPGLCKQNKLLGSNVFKLTKKNINKYIDQNKYSTFIKIDVTKINKDFDLILESQITLIINSKSIRAKIKKIESNTIDVRIEFPIFINGLDKIPLLALYQESITVFGFGKIIDFEPNVILKLPTNYTEYYEALPNDKENIKIINDVIEPNFDVSEFNIDNLKENMKDLCNEINSNVNSVKFPDLMINYEPLKITWINFIEYINMIQEISNNAVFNVETRIYNLEKVIQPYIQYSYGLSNSSDVGFLNDNILVHIKTKRLKQKLDKVIKLFFKHYYYCESCKKLSGLLVKVCVKPYKICIQCSNRKQINDEWIKYATIS